MSLMKYNMKNITITEIAKLAGGVSPSTVSLVLNGKVGGVGPETRERVLSIARENRYKGLANSNLHKKNTRRCFLLMS